MAIGLYGTGLMTSTGFYPNLKWARVTAAATCGAVWANALQTAVYSFQNDMYNAKGDVSTLASYFRVLLASTGGFTTGFDHDALLGIATNQHHNKLHQADHITLYPVTWESNLVGAAQEPYDMIAFNSALVAGLSYNIYRSTDGEAWSIVSADPDEAVFAEFNGDLYAGGEGGAVYSSSDGITWGSTNSPVAEDIYTMCVFGSYMYAACADKKVYRMDSGDNWSAALVTFDDAARSSVVFDSYLYMGTEDGTGNGVIHRSSDGSSWSEVFDTGEAEVSCLYVYRNQIYAGTGDNGILYRSNNGTYWQHAATLPGKTGSSYIRSMYSWKNNLWLGTDNSPDIAALYRSGNGTAWTIQNPPNRNSYIGIAILSAYWRRDWLYCLGLAGGHTYAEERKTIETHDAVATQAGYAPLDSVWRLDTVATKATIDSWKTSGYYVGDGDPVATTILDYRPAYVSIRKNIATGVHAEVLDTVTYGLMHAVGTSAEDKHTRPKASETIKISASGFRTYFDKDLNATNVTYFFTAIKETP